ncbi:Transcriptional factor SWI5 [Paramyrothecium foliicola]|nr:Transcriptional factor SWI5 [Paramyrothecium foliicola]
MSDEFEPSDWRTETDAVPNTSWATSMRSNSACSSIGSIPSSEHDSFNGYDNCLPTSYANSEGYPPPHLYAEALPRTPSSSVGVAPTTAYSSRSSLTYPQDHMGRQGALHDTTNWDPSLDYSYPAMAGLQAPYGNNRVMFSSSPQPYAPEDPELSWMRQPYDTRKPYSGSSSRSLNQSGVPHQTEVVSRPRRAIRKHTTKEEANFQCDVPGCGKFFSRHYNYKSHLETHDESREYPFPCAEEGCCKKFVRRTDLQRHHQSVHMKERNHKCDYCGRPFARKDTLRRHMEDGCSRRFDLRTPDLRSEGHNDSDILPRASRANTGGLPPSTDLLPPIIPRHR